MATAITSLHVYPLKSAAGISVPAVEVDEVGLKLDRRWMVVDAEGRFMSQRTHPRMALLGTELADEALRVTMVGHPTLVLPLDGRASGSMDKAGGNTDPTGRLTVRVWFEDRFGTDCGDDVAAWMSSALGAPCRVLRATEPADGVRVSAEGRVRAGFADARPALVIASSSLDDLNRHLRARGGASVPMNRFRPNVVLGGADPYEEDRWGSVRAGDVTIHGLCPCARCVTTTVDQSRGVAEGPEPLRTLATYRRMEDGEVSFGMNVRFEGTGTLRVGATITPTDT